MRKRIKTNKKDVSLIPKKIHCIWLGPKQPPYLQKFMKTYETFAPDYNVRLWGDKDITKKNFPKTYTYIQKVKKYQGVKINEYTGQKTMYKTNKDEYTYSKYAQISDLMRYEIVYNEGGFYFDANMFLVKDISQLFNTKTKFIGCNELSDTLQHSPILSNSFFGSIPKSPILKRLLSKSFLDSMDLRTLDVDFVTGPGALRSVIKSSDNYTMLPSKTFYPYIMPWTPDGGDHPLRKSHKSKCSGSKQTKKRTLNMKPGLWLEFPCHKYKGTYGIKVWESGGSWTRPQKWYEQSGSKRYSVYQSGGNNKRGNNKGGNNKRGIEQKGGVAPAVACVPCMANPIGMGVTVAGACAYGINEIYKCSNNKGLKEKGSKKKGSKKKGSKKKGSKKK